MRPERAAVGAVAAAAASAALRSLSRSDFGALDAYFFGEGTHTRLFETFGAHVDEQAQCVFRVWAPNAVAVSVIGDFNDWNPQAPLSARWDGSGVWEGTVANVPLGSRYKYRIVAASGEQLDKADPFATFAEVAPATASVVTTLDYAWNDEAWMRQRAARNALDAPMSIYEVHLGSWRRPWNGTMAHYRDIAEPLARYVSELGFTHVELLPITEHPFYGSGGYQTTGYFAPTSRYGSPQDFMFLVDTLHQHGIGVILDWVPSHFPDDPHGLARFDGTHLYEHADPRQGFHPEWNSLIFNYGRNEVRSFLLSSATFWLTRYHIDALRVDAVASMLYLDYARRPGEWVPNEKGGRENLQAVQFLRALNTATYRNAAGTQTIAEESTAWPSVSRPVEHGGLGFGLKWNMGWMHDTLEYMRLDAIYRRHHQDRLTFSLVYAFSENFVLPLSHDEVVYGKGSLLQKMPGDKWQKFAGLRALFGYQWAHPGKKLIFMGSEFAQRAEWAHEAELDWLCLGDEMHAGVQRWVSDLNRLLRAEPALHERDFDQEGFAWIDASNADASVLAFERRARSTSAPIVAVACNFTPVPRSDYRLGVSRAGRWREALNSDAAMYGGSNVGNLGGVSSEPVAAHERAQSIVITLPPLATIFFVHES
ncbi:MAG: 1,4-alpha-glucan branching protein GlgB [Burkholderiaceae bacterium]